MEDVATGKLEMSMLTIVVDWRVDVRVEKAVGVFVQPSFSKLFNTRFACERYWDRYPASPHNNLSMNIKGIPSFLYLVALTVEADHAEPVWNTSV
uniref:AlNc14C212G8928 protein n=1 Tax=Albugo laibachii Nc14 TaxID=890382 RepID=F0WRC3_9STRA|nr:AlNc14C212G8928 [Albugo laibachii Nc14]|eukprot:CCA23886.1 AlNc14C212G8928 [Albugo laibachii Nc14]